MTNNRTMWTIRGHIEQSEDKMRTKGHDDQYLKGISTTSSEFSFIPGYIFLYILDDMINAKETNNIEQKIHIHTN